MVQFHILLNIAPAELIKNECRFDDDSKAHTSWRNAPLPAAESTKSIVSLD